MLLGAEIGEAGRGRQGAFGVPVARPAEIPIRSQLI
jgi:hypothetical protein